MRGRAGFYFPRRSLTLPLFSRRVSVGRSATAFAIPWRRWQDGPGSCGTLAGRRYCYMLIVSEESDCDVGNLKKLSSKLPQRLRKTKPLLRTRPEHLSSRPAAPVGCRRRCCSCMWMSDLHRPWLGGCIHLSSMGALQVASQITTAAASSGFTFASAPTAESVDVMRCRTFAATVPAGAAA